MTMIHFCQQISCGLIRLGGSALGGIQMADRVLHAEWRALKLCSKESGTPVVGTCLGNPARVGNRHKRWKILVFGSQGIGYPRSNAGETILNKAGGKKIFSRPVGISLKSANERTQTRPLIQPNVVSGRKPIFLCFPLVGNYTGVLPDSPPVPER